MRYGTVTVTRFGIRDPRENLLGELAGDMRVPQRWVKARRDAKPKKTSLNNSKYYFKENKFNHEIINHDASWGYAIWR
jgi:hypothetical protein